MTAPEPRAEARPAMPPTTMKRDYGSARWCGECRWAVVEDPPCCFTAEDLTAMSEPTVTRPGEAAAVEAAWNTVHDAILGNYASEDYAVKVVTDFAAAVRAEERERIAQHRCGAEHPDNVTIIPCMLDPGHERHHWSTSGCTGGAFAWPSEAMRLRAVQAALAAPLHYAIDPRLAREEPTE